MQEFELNGEYIQLSQLLKAARWIHSGGTAMLVIDEGEVEVNGEQELRRRRKLRAGDEVKWENRILKIVAKVS